jgi:hypothetical protein
VHTHIYTHVHTHTKNIRTYVHTHKYIRTTIFAHTHTHTHTHTYSHTFTHIHTGTYQTDAESTSSLKGLIDNGRIVQEMRGEDTHGRSGDGILRAILHKHLFVVIERIWFTKKPLQKGERFRERTHCVFEFRKSSGYAEMRHVTMHWVWIDLCVHVQIYTHRYTCSHIHTYAHAHAHTERQCVREHEGCSEKVLRCR